ncbi:MAG: ABC transporter ATP-binding protein [Chloroflexota bacterium]|nr:ABC transporter ATP-binding protein [Chloroflexota bacterium]
MEAVIQTQDLTKTYGAHRGIQGLNLTVHQGEVFGFLGPNGAGKTTTIRTLMGFLRPTSGRATVLGLDTQRDSVRVRAQLGNLPGEFSLEDAMTGSQLISLFGRLRGVSNLSYAHQLAERLGADLNRPVRRLSRGNKQKLGLIQAMFHRPPLLILDEPTGGLDPLVQEEFLRIIEETRAEGRTVFFSSHNLFEVEHVCDRVGIIREGELVTVEDVDTLTTRHYRHLALTFSSPVQAAPFAALPGVSDVQAEGATLRLTVHDSLDSVIKLAAQHTVLDLEMEHPSLEEIFLTYYGGTQ